MLSARSAALVVAAAGLTGFGDVAVGTGGQSSLVYPVDVVASDEGLVVADFKMPGVLSIDRTGNVVELARGAGRPRTPLYGTRAVHPAPDGGGWLVADPGTYALYRVRRSGELELVTDQLDIPLGIAGFDDRSVLVSDLRAGIGAVMRVTLDGEVSVFAELDSPRGIVADGADGFAVVSTGDRAVYGLGRDGRVSERFRGPPLEFPHDIVRLDDGTLLITDGYAGVIWSLSRAGRLQAWRSGPPLVAPQGITLADDGTVFVADPQAGAIFRIARDGQVERWVEATGGR